METEPNLKADFPAPSYAAWEELRDAQLKGRPYDKLTWRTADGFELPPLLHPRPSAGPGVDAPERVLACTRVLELDPPELFEWREALGAGFDLVRVVIALEHELQDGDAIDFDAVLDGMPQGKVLLEADNPHTEQLALAHCAGKRNGVRVVASFDDYGSNLDTWGRTPAQELAIVLAHAIWTLRGCPNPSTFSRRNSRASNLHPRQIALHTALGLYVGTNVIEDVAKLRAARLLYDRVVAAFDVDDPAARRAFICAETSPDSSTWLDQHTNLLRTTLQAFAASVGGADAISLAPYDMPRSLFAQDTPNRLALNQLRLLREESFIDRVRDPAAGAHVIEHLTDSIARRAWELMQRIEVAGGFQEALWNESLAELVGADETDARTRSDVATRRRSVVGISRFASPPAEPANAEEEQDALLLSDEDDPPPQAAARAAIPFELLHLRANADAAARGQRARVLLLPLGSIPQRRARADFAADLFRAGGFDVIDPHGLDDVDAAVDAVHEHEPQVVVLCGADEEYAAFAPRLITRLSAGRDPLPFYVAGRPPEDSDDWGVTGFVHVGVDCVEVLTQAQRLAGIEGAA